MKKKDAAKGVDDALAWLVAESEAHVLRPGEFTVEMAREKLGGSVTGQALRHRFASMVASGELTSRKVLVKGKWVNAWKRK